jgi:hypothetical protein
LDWLIGDTHNMARQIRHNVEGGWYHITTRGMGRREIFSCDRDRALYVARMNCGLTIAELTSLAGTESTAASKAIQRMKKRLSCDRKLKSILRKVSADTSVSGI